MVARARGAELSRRLSTTPPAGSYELILGSLADFPAGTARCVERDGMRVEVISGSAGLRAVLRTSEGMQAAPLRLSAGGLLCALPEEPCRADEVLSLFTGEMVRIEEGEA